ncbi:hypothetical protein [Luteolibacter soli]|uniref:Uncharacterized protein n=1 Tax=Luteolibacter soli TaxID=3135280 RepID=A0ABU9B1Y2_9BACT
MKSTLSAILYLLVTLTLRSEVMVGPSLEWLADTSASVGIYRVTQTRKESDSSFQLSFSLDESLKATPPQSASSPYWLGLPKDPQPSSVAEEDRFLIFFKSDEKDEARIAHLINLSTPKSRSLMSVAINCKFEVLAEQAAILAVVRGRIKSRPTTTSTKWREYPASRFDVEVPKASPAFIVLWYGSDCYLLLPEDLKPVNLKK